jgi:mono/diheme cytochrome c family protein
MLRSFLGLLVALALVGCPQPQGGTDEAAASPAGSTEGSAEPSDADREEAKTIFSTRCTACHGENGAGDGAASSGLDPKPRDLTAAEWQDSVDDEFIEKIIKYGGAAVGKSAAMPSNPDMSSKPKVLTALRDHVRGLRAN